MFESDLMPPGRGITINVIYAAPKAIAWQIPFIRQLRAENFEQSSRTFVGVLRECLPGLPEDEILWRFHFMLGTIYYSATSPQRIKTFSRGRCDPGDLEATVRHLVPFLAAAFRSAPVLSQRRPRRKPAATRKH